MKKQRILTSVLAVALLLALTVGLTQAQGPGPQGDVSVQATSVGTAFTYQGRLTDGGSPANGEYDFRFKLYDAVSGGAQVGSTVTKEDTTVTDGLFTVELDFGNDIFTGEARYLEIDVRPGDSTGPYTTLNPRQALTAAPYALALPGLWTQPNATSPNVIGGYFGNSVTSGKVGATIGGGGASGNINSATDDYCTVAGGIGNRAGYPSGGWSTAAAVGGGEGNVANTHYTTVSGGKSNAATGWASTIGGGTGNDAAANHSTIGGGSSNDAGSAPEDGVAATVAGGWHNQALANYATIGGGGGDSSATGNRVTDDYGTVGGGHNNQAGDDAGTTSDRPYATVGGGFNNTASGSRSTIGGGEQNTATGYLATVGGGFNNTAGFRATVGGGDNNSATGSRSTVGGGNSNTASGSYSFAAGRRAKANHQGAFVWGDSTDTDVVSTGNNQFNVRASGGALFFSSGDLSTGVYLAPGSEMWTPISASDRNLKENFAPVDGQETLARLAEIPITTWNYKAGTPGARHMSPMAQDFYAAFGLGEDDKHLSALDTNGVALAAIQALAEENTALHQQVDDLEARVAALEAAGGAAPARPLQSGLLPGAGVLLVGLGLVWLSRRGNTLEPLKGGKR